MSETKANKDSFNIQAKLNATFPHLQRQFKAWESDKRDEARENKRTCMRSDDGV